MCAVREMQGKLLHRQGNAIQGRKSQSLACISDHMQAPSDKVYSDPNFHCNESTFPKTPYRLDLIVGVLVNFLSGIESHQLTVRLAQEPRQTKVKTLVKEILS